MKNKLIGQGRTAEIFLTNKNKIIKLFKQGITQETVNLEYEIHKHIEKSEIPIPKTYNLVKIEDRYGIVYEYIKGNSMLNKIFNNPWQIINEAKRLADLHLIVHNYNCEKLPSQREKLIQDISKVDLITEKEKELIIRYLETLDDDVTICHGDFHPDNILLTDKGPIIIDWLTGTSGNLKADVARTILLLKNGSLPPEISKHKNILLCIIRSIFHYVYINRYIVKSKISRSELEEWKLPVAAARLSENLPKEEKSRLLKTVKKKLREELFNYKDNIG